MRAGSDDYCSECPHPYHSGECPECDCEYLLDYGGL